MLLFFLPEIRIKAQGAGEEKERAGDELLGNEGMLVIPDGLPKEELDVCPYERKKLEARELRSVRSIPLHDQSTRKNIH